MPSSLLKTLCWSLLGCFIASTSQAAVYPLPPPNEDVIGQMQVVHAHKSDTLLDIARRYDLGYEDIIHANPEVDRWLPGHNTPIVLPTRYILPDTPREGAVLNISEMRLYYYPKNGSQVYTYPVSIGRMDWKTPQGKTSIIAKTVDPVWRPPASIKAEHAADGDPLPDVVPAGPNNPLGRYAMRLGVPGYLIHSTNKPYGIGMRVTHGCVRMYPENIKQLFGMIPVGTPVRIIDQPVKVGWLNGDLFIESHEPLEENNLPIKVTLEQAQRVVSTKVGADLSGISQAALESAVEKVNGIPVAISGRSFENPRSNTASFAQERPASTYQSPSQVPAGTPVARGQAGRVQTPVYPAYPPDSVTALPEDRGVARPGMVNPQAPVYPPYPVPRPLVTAPGAAAPATYQNLARPRAATNARASASTTYRNFAGPRASSAQPQVSPSRRSIPVYRPETAPVAPVATVRPQNAPSAYPPAGYRRPVAPEAAARSQLASPRPAYRPLTAPVYKPQRAYPPAPLYRPPDMANQSAFGAGNLPPPPAGYPPVYRTTTAAPYPRSYTGDNSAPPLDAPLPSDPN
ncbi:MAG: hypothetical protein CSA09_00330 [Candidatus Contendobacter odensis]|uniref:L,D-TPase catalytic domain-containing protein n=1 Tax=Candidatus Contendibacter odensensis TaxID=1400860 RepID=A0A2G6PGN0_9GAMM|nr:MAG: hypothetical protein CSA09_00330 [Candidatus Contendobacter odensis]